MMTKRFLFAFQILVAGLSVGCAEVDGLHYRSQPQLSSDGNRIVASVNSGGTPSVYELSLRGDAPMRLTQGSDVSPAVSPDGNTVVFARKGANDRQSLYLLDRRMGTTRALTPEQHDDFPVFVDAHSVAFLRARTLRNTSTGGQRWVDWDVFVLDIGSAVERRVTSASYWEATPPSAMPGEASVLLSAGRLGEERRPILVNLKSGETKPVGAVDDGPASALDSKSMISLRRTGTDPKTDNYFYDLFESSLDGSRHRRLTNLNTYCDRPSYQREAGLLFFLTIDSRSGPFELWQMTLDGRPTKLSVRLPEWIKTCSGSERYRSSM